ncbi:MAG: hypothetical protein AB7C89_01090 [Intestinibacillus sp.]
MAIFMIGAFALIAASVVAARVAGKADFHVDHVNQMRYDYR